MTEIPARFIAFQRLFPDAGARRLVAVRWPNGFQCPACGHGRGWQLKIRSHSFECARCHRQASVAAGTLLHRTRPSLAIWFWAACLMGPHCNAKNLGNFAVPRDRHQPHVVGDRPAPEILAWIHTALCNLKGCAPNLNPAACCDLPKRRGTAWRVISVMAHNLNAVMKRPALGSGCRPARPKLSRWRRSPSETRNIARRPSEGHEIRRLNGPPQAAPLHAGTDWFGD